jgi:hypothetical protein
MEWSSKILDNILKYIHLNEMHKSTIMILFYQSILNLY